MSFISMMEARLPPGFRFYPRDDELVLDYLWHKQHSGSARGGGSAYGGVVMIDVDLNKCEPWDLPEVACVGGKEWYFFSLHDRKYATGERTNRATQSGYWKATGKDRCISRHGAVVGMRKTLVFYHGRAPKGKKTEWVMHEFRMEGNVLVDHPKFFKKDWVLCKVFCRSRTAGPAPAADEAGSLSNEIAVPTAPPPFTPLADAYIAFDHSMTGAIEGYKLVSCFSGQEPAIKSPASSANLPASGTGDDSKAIRTVLSAKLEFPQDWRQEQDEHFMHGNGMSHVWNP